jgi:hypothetical protein
VEASVTVTPNAAAVPSGVDLAALHEALDAAMLAAFIAEGGDDPECVREALATASLAAADAFPADSSTYTAFCQVLNEIATATLPTPEGTSRS